jgi:phosphatidylinositol alpha-1,6-mannosyltransferase
MPAVKRWWLRRTLLGSHRVVAVSTFTAGRVVSDCPALEPRVAVLPNGVDPNRFVPGPKSADLLRQFGLSSTDVVILTLARVVPRKGHDQVILSLPRILAEVPRAKYLICGPGSEQHVEGLRRQAGELGVGDAAVFGGYVAPERLNDVYNLCDVYVMTSRVIEEEGDVEGFGITFLEANACGKPVVGGNSGGVPDAVVDGENGFLVDPTSHTEIANTVIQLLNDPTLTGRLGRQGLDRIGRRYTWNAIATQFDGAILSTVGS